MIQAYSVSPIFVVDSRACHSHYITGGLIDKR